MDLFFDIESVESIQRRKTYRKALVCAVGTEYQEKAKGADQEGMGGGPHLELAPHAGPDGIGAGQQQPMDDGHEGRPPHDGQDRSLNVAQNAGVRQRGDVVDPILGRMSVVDLGQVGLSRAIGGKGCGAATGIGGGVKRKGGKSGNMRSNVASHGGNVSSFLLFTFTIFFVRLRRHRPKVKVGVNFF